MASSACEAELITLAMSLKADVLTCNDGVPGEISGNAHPLSVLKKQYGMLSNS